MCVCVCVCVCVCSTALIVCYYLLFFPPLLDNEHNRYIAVDNKGTTEISSTLNIGQGTTLANLGNTVNIKTGALVTLESSVDTLTVGSLIMSGGTMILNGVGVVSGPLDFRSGVLTAKNTLQITSYNNTITGGTLNGTGIITVTNDLTLSGGTISATNQINLGTQTNFTSGTVSLSKVTLVNNGILGVTGSITGSNSALLKNNALIELRHGGQIYGSGWQINNIGTIALETFSTNSSTVNLQATITNTGSIDVNSGTLALKGGGSSAGTINVQDTLVIDGGSNSLTLTATSKLAGNGTVIFSSGKTSISCVLDLDGELIVQGGNTTIEAVATISTLAEHMVIKGTGILTINTLSGSLPSTDLLGGSLILNTDLDFPGSFAIYGGSHVFNGEVTFAGDLWMSGGLSINYKMNLLAGFTMVHIPCSPPQTKLELWFRFSSLFRLI